MAKFKINKLMMLASAAVVVLPIAVAYAAVTSVPVTVTFRQAVSLTTTRDLAFGRIDYASATVTGADTVTITPAGVATPGGGFTLGAGLPRTSGNVRVNLADNAAASVYCDTSATLTSGANTITVNALTFSASGGADTACAGIGTGAGSFTLAGGVNADNITVGGTLDGGTASGGTIVSAAYVGSLNLDVIYD